MLDDILDLFNRRKRQPAAKRSPAEPEPGLPFGLPFLDADDEQDERDRHRHEDERKPGRRSSSHRSSDGSDLF